MLFSHCAKSASARACSVWRVPTPNRAHAAFSSLHLGTVIQTKVSHSTLHKFHPEPKPFALVSPFAISRSCDVFITSRTVQMIRSNHSASQPINCYSQRKEFLRYISSASSRSDDIGISRSGQGGSGGSTAGAAESHTVLVDGNPAMASYKGRYQEEVAQSLDIDTARIDLGKLISSPSELKGLHASLQSSLRSSGDKQIMSMTIEDIQNILKGEFRRRASQTASVEIWKALLVVGGLLFVLYWGQIGKEVADQTARVTTLTLEDKQLQDKAFQLANVIVNNVLTNPNVVDQAAVFLQIAVANLTAKPETQAVLLQITQSTLAHLIAQESTLALISDLLGRAAIQALDDPAVKSKVADTIAWVLQEKYVVDQSAKLASSASVETLADEVVQKQSKEFIENILNDETIKKKTAAAVWGVIGNMFIPAFFTKASPSASSAPIASKTGEEQQPLPTTTALPERNSTPWYHFSGVLGWVLPSFRKRTMEDTIPEPDTSNHGGVSDQTPSPSGSLTSLDHVQTFTISPSTTPNKDSRSEQRGSTVPSDSMPSVSTNFSQPRSSQTTQIPCVPHHVALLVPPSTAHEGDNSLTDDDKRGAVGGERRS